MVMDKFIPRKRRFLNTLFIGVKPKVSLKRAFSNVCSMSRYFHMFAKARKNISSKGKNEIAIFYILRHYSIEAKPRQLAFKLW